MRQRRHTYNRDAERRARLAKLESDPLLQASLLQATAWCPLHGCEYPANHMVGGHVEAQLCPQCMAERERRYQHGETP
jgi:hypothetical protein